MLADRRGPSATFGRDARSRMRRMSPGHHPHWAMPRLRGRDHDPARIRRGVAPPAGATAVALSAVPVDRDHPVHHLRAARDRRGPHRAEGSRRHRRRVQPPEPLRRPPSGQDGRRRSPVRHRGHRSAIGRDESLQRRHWIGRTRCTLLTVRPERDGDPVIRTFLLRQACRGAAQAVHAPPIGQRGLDPRPRPADVVGARSVPSGHLRTPGPCRPRRSTRRARPSTSGWCRAPGPPR